MFSMVCTLNTVITSPPLKSDSVKSSAANFSGSNPARLSWNSAKPARHLEIRSELGESPLSHSLNSCQNLLDILLLNSYSKQSGNALRLLPDLQGSDYFILGPKIGAVEYLRYLILGSLENIGQKTVCLIKLIWICIFCVVLFHLYCLTDPLQFV